jgi:hypothetical protein
MVMMVIEKGEVELIEHLMNLKAEMLDLPVKAT